MSPIEVAKSYLANSEHYNHMQDGRFEVQSHDIGPDAHLVQHLDGVDDSHLDTDGYDVVTVAKNIEVEGGFQIPKVLKLNVKGDKVTSVLESK